LGQQADVESLRVTAVEFAHQEGFLRSEQDVTIQRVVGFALSAPLRRAYGDITVAPFVVNALFAEINETPEEDLFFTLRYDGEFDSRRGFAVVAGTSEAERRALEFLEGAYSSALSLEEAQALADRAWRVAADVEGTGEPLPELVSGTQPEVGYLARESRRERRFRHLAG
jgi:proteasome alpha subunit